MTGFSATRTDAVVNITADLGVAGNVDITVTPSTAYTVVAMSGGNDEGTFTFGTDVLTQGTDFTAATSNTATADSLKDAITALSGYTATINATDNTQIDIVADSEGLAGNVAMSTNQSEAVTITQMSGGADYFYSDTFDYDNIDNSSITGIVNLNTLSAGGKLDVVLETSMHKDSWHTAYEFDTMESTGSQMITISDILNFARFRFTVDGTATVNVKAMASQFGGDAQTIKSIVRGEKVIADDGTGSPDVPVALTTNSVSFKYIDIVADINNAGDITIGDVVFTPGMSKRYTQGNLKNINITAGTIGDKVVWDGERT